MKRNLLFVAFVVIVNTALFGQDTSLFQCPMKRGKIIIEHRNHQEGKMNPGAEIESKDERVYSSSPGFVKSIDTVDGRVTIFIVFENYSFSYHNLNAAFIEKGKNVKKGEIIGRVKERQRLFLIIYKDKEPIDPASIIRCKVIHREV